MNKAIKATPRAKKYFSREEAEREHPRLHAENPLPLPHFKDLVGEYELRREEWIRCQLVDAKGHCHEEHGKGWIAQLADDSEGYMGHRCAKLHFEDDPRFAELFKRAEARVTEEIKTGRLVSALAALLETPNFRATVSDLKGRWNELYQRAVALPSQLTDALRKELASRKKRDDAAVLIKVVTVTIEVDEVTKRERRIVTRDPVRVGSLSGVKALDYRPLSRIGTRLNKAQDALQEAVAGDDQPHSKLSHWVAALEYVRAAEEHLAEHEAALDAFCRPENLKLLWLLCADRFDQLAAIRVALELTSRKRVSDAQVAAAREAWTKEIKGSQGGREFEIGRQ